MKDSAAALWEIYRLTETVEDAYQGDFSHRMQGDAPLAEEDNPSDAMERWGAAPRFLSPHRQN